jgi:hypothetical protein
VIHDCALEQLLCEALRARAERLGLDASSIRTPSPGALTAKRLDGPLLRLDYRTYEPPELSR